jgi:hypothetical protein
MSKKNIGINNKNFEEESSDDSITGMENPEEPLFYMFPDSSDEEGEKKEKLFEKNIKNIPRKKILSKLDLLSKYHKKSEDKLANSKIGWHTIYELFFEKLFFIDKELKENSILINLKEVEIRIRRELGKIGKESKNKPSVNSSFPLFDKMQDNPPVSSWYSNNFINDNLNRLIAPKEKNSYICNVINEFINFEDKKEETKNDNENIELNNSNKSNNISKSSKKVTSNKNIHVQNNFMDNMMKKLNKIRKEDNFMDDTLYEEIRSEKDLIQKGAKKIIDKFIKKYNISNTDYVEDEISNIQTNEKAYEIELRNMKLFESKFLDENKFLIDFNYLRNAMQKEKKDNYTENKKELDQLFSQINKTIDLIKENSL